MSASLAWLGAAMVVLTGLVAAAVWSFRVARADGLARMETLEATQEAARWIEEDALYHYRLGLLKADRDPGGSLGELERAAALNPRDAATWMELGLRYEAEGKPEKAEQYLLKAAEVDGQYLPRWTLVNFYFRQKNTGKFWEWAKSSTEMVYGDPRPLFRLCGAVVEDGLLIERLRMAKPEVRAGYLAYLMEQHKPELMMPAVRTVLSEDREGDVPVLTAACDRLLDGGYAEGAIDVWNGLARRHRIGFEAVGADIPGLINGAFGSAPSSSGFDWRLAALEGVSAAEEEGGGLRLSFSGRQPEDCELLSQFKPMRENLTYEVTLQYRAPLAADSGLRWRVMDALTGGVLGEGGDLSSQAERRESIRFRTPGGCRMVRIALEYRRRAGTTRIKGFVVLRAVDIRPVS